MPAGLKLVYDREGERVAYPIPEGETFIGRKDYCDLCFPDASVSKRHVRIVREGSAIELFDAGSRNGTVVNGRTVDRVELQPGDVIQVGKITLTVAPDGGGGSIPVDSSRRSVGNDPVPSRGKGGKSRDSFKDFDDFDEESTRRETGWTSQASQASKTQASRTKDSEPKKTLPPAADEPEAADVPAARFTITAGDGKGKVVQLDPNAVVTIGTKEENAIPLKGEGISRYHAEVLVENGVWVLKDLGSRNGSFVAGRKVDLHELAPGDEVQIGTVLLRFDQDAVAGKAASGGPISAKALVDSFKKDPKAFFKGQQGKQAILVVIGILLLVVILMPAAQPQGGGNTLQPGVVGPTSTLPHQVIELLKTENASRALDVLARNQRQFQESPVLRDLNELAKTWESHPQPLTFDWTNAGPQIEKVQRAGTRELDKDCLDWLAEAAKEVDEELPNYKLTVRGSTEMTRSSTLRNREFKGYVEALRSALEAYRGVPRGSRLRDSAETQAQKARVQLFKALVAEAERLAAMDPPPWQDSIALLRQALEFGETLEEKRPVLHKVDEYEAAQKDEDSFAKAVDYVQRRDVNHYDDAVALLKNVSKNSRVYMDAQTYLHWIQADRDVRNAKLAYDAGDWERALMLLNSALKVTELGPEAKQSVTRRIDQWGRVVGTYKKGQEAYDRSDFDGARVLFGEVVKLEPNAKNRYRQLADAQLLAIQARWKDIIESAKKDGLAYLGTGRYGDAFEKFKLVVEKTSNEPRLRAQLNEAVARVNRERRLYFNLKKRWSGDPNSIPTNELLNMQYTLKLLKHFLPKKTPTSPGDPDQEGAWELYDKVKNYLEREKRIRAAEKDDLDEGQ